MSEKLLTEREAAAYLGMSVSWLRNGRSQQRVNIPPYVKISNRVRYRRADLDNWLAAHVVMPGEAA
jgi:predicted DNA-binding transcriptional regulator AlpA